MKEIQVRFTKKNAIAFGGMKLMKDMLDSSGIKEFISCQGTQTPLAIVNHLSMKHLK